MNSRLDEMQAAILRARLPWLPELDRAAPRAGRALSVGARGRAGRRCRRSVDPGHVYHLFPVLAQNREELQAHLADRGIGTLIHYPIPMPRQPAFAEYSPRECPIADRVCAEVCSLPLYPQLSDADAREVAAAVHAFRDRRGSMVSSVR